MHARSLDEDELQVLKIVAAGKSTEEAGTVLKIHKSIVQDRLRIAARKLGAINRTHAVAIAVELGLLRVLHREQRKGLHAQMTDREERIRERAFYIWLDEGKPHGRAQAHWLLAEREIASEESSGSNDVMPLPNPFDPEGEK